MLMWRFTPRAGANDSAKMHSGHSKQASRALATQRRTSGWRIRLLKAATWFAGTGLAALACGGTENNSADNRAADDTTDGTASGGTGAGPTTTVNPATSNTTTGATTPDPSTKAAFDDWLREVAVTLCEKNCADAAYLEVLYGADCAETATQMYAAWGLRLWNSIEAGNMSFDATEAQRCIDDWAATECGLDPQFQDPSRCDKAFAGRVGLDGADGVCHTSLECAGGGFCDGCVGLCVPRPAEGESCTLGLGVQECQIGLTCLAEAEGVCGAPKANGEYCQLGSDCLSGSCNGADRCEDPIEYGWLVREVDEPCSMDQHCKLGLYCYQGVEDRCRPAHEVGEPCGRNTDPCVPEAYCFFESNDLEGVCAERIPVGGVCGAGEECVTGACDDGVCAVLSGLGGPCVTGAGCWQGTCEGRVCVAPEPECF